MERRDSLMASCDSCLLFFGVYLFGFLQHSRYDHPLYLAPHPLTIYAQLVHERSLL